MVAWSLNYCGDGSEKDIINIGGAILLQRKHTGVRERLIHMERHIQYQFSILNLGKTHGADGEMAHGVTFLIFNFGGTHASRKNERKGTSSDLFNYQYSIFNFNFWGTYGREGEIAHGVAFSTFSRMIVIEKCHVAPVVFL